MDENESAVIRLKKAILDADYDATPMITKEALEAGVDPEILMKESLSQGIRELEKKLFGDYKVWVHPVFLMAMEGVRLSLEILEPHMKPKEEKALGTVVLGTPAGDTHDLGAKMVALALTASGFKVNYLGRDVPLTRFIHQVQETNATILGISSYQTSGFRKIEEILSLLETAKIQNKVNVMLGGTVITEKFADQLNVDYGRHASDAVKLAHQYIGR
jgi:methylmalonyl-CoA mutase cobalamin-binding domain/chain